MAWAQYPPEMPEVLVVSDSSHVREEVIASLPDTGFIVRELNHGTDVLPAVLEKTPDLLIVDSQVGRMGGMAVALDLHLEEGAGRAPHVPILMLLDRRADVFLAKRSDAEGWFVKPVDPLRLGRAISTIMAGGTYYDDAYLPPTVALH